MSEAESLRPGSERRARMAPTVAVAVLLLTFAWIAISGASWAQLVASDLREVDRRLDDAEARYRQVPGLSTEQLSALRRSLNAAHIAAGERLGTGPVPRRADLDDAAQARGLSLIQSDSAREVRAGRHSVPYLTPQAAVVLDSIAARFRRRLVASGLPAFRVTVTSVWRSAEDQAALTRVNVNAARGRSSHEFATTFDLAYRRFDYASAGGLLLPRPSDRLPAFLKTYVFEESARRAERRFGRLAEQQPAPLEAALGRTLITLENDGLALVIRETRQPVYHVTSAR